MFAVKEIYGDMGVAVIHEAYETKEEAKEAARNRPASSLQYYTVTEVDKEGNEIESPWEW